MKSADQAFEELRKKYGFPPPSLYCKQRLPIPMIRHVKDLSHDQRVAMEAILGRALDEREALSIRPVSVVRDAPSSERKREVAEQLRSYFARLDAEPPQGSPKELDEAIDEALSHARPSYKPMQ